MVYQGIKKINWTMRIMVLRHLYLFISLIVITAYH